MKARSLVFDLFGDYLRYRGGEVRLRALVALMDCFDVPEATVRVVVTRLRNEGWLASRRDGRETVYALTDAAWQLLDEGRDPHLRRAPGPWDGQWHMVIYSVPESERGLREQLRKRLTWLGFGPLSAVGLAQPARPRRRRCGTTSRTSRPCGWTSFRSRSDGLAADRDMAGTRLGSGRRSTATTPPARDATSPAARLPGRRADRPRGAGRAHAPVHDYRLFPFRDPDLPPELLPEGWSAGAAHEVFLEAHGLLRAPAEAYVDADGSAAMPRNEQAERAQIVSFTRRSSYTRCRSRYSHAARRSDEGGTTG